MANFRLDSLITRDNMVKAANWLLAKVPTGLKVVLVGYVAHEGGKTVRHAIDKHHESLKHAIDKATESEGYLNVTHDGDFNFDARKRSGAPEHVDGAFADVDTPEAIPETI